MNTWRLPTSLEIGGVGWNIRTDFRDILYAISYFNNPNYELDEAWEICLTVVIENYKNMPSSLKNEAVEKVMEFIDMGTNDDDRPKPRVMDWEQDAPIIIPAINKVMGREVRSMEYCHWWTFMGAYMEIGENSLFSNILNIRLKKAEGKKLEKHEQEFYRKNKSIVVIKEKYTEEELKEMERFKALFD